MTQKIVVTGASGFLGRNLLPLLYKQFGAENVRGLNSGDYDLMKPAQVSRMFQDTHPDVLVHLAAYSGGIGANRSFPADFFYKNIILSIPVFQAAYLTGVKKMIYPMGGCSYPALAHSPIDETQMWDGYPQQESAGYSVAKKMGLVASASYRQQYGFNSVVLIPGNMYGKFDNYREGESHVVPAMIRRYYESQRSGAKTIRMWGTGKPVRDFVLASDVAATIPYFVEHYDSSEPVNISTGSTTSIRELAETIRNLLNYDVEIEWDENKPDGQMVKIFDVTRLHALGLSCPTPLSNGLQETITWFRQNYETRGDGLRL